MFRSNTRTAPAWCSSRPSEQTEVTGLLTNTSAPSARWPIPVRGTKALLPTPNPHRGVLPLAQVGLTVPRSTSRSRFCRTLRTDGLIEASRPHCPMVTVPSVAMTSERAPGRSVRQNLDLLVGRGTVNPTCANGSTPLWGFGVGNNAFVPRTGIGQRADGALVFVNSPVTSVCSLGRLLHQAGAVRVLERNINNVSSLEYYYPPRLL